MADIPVATNGQIDHHTIDRYTPAHAAVGFVMGIARAPWWLAVSTAVGWEVVESRLKQARPDLFHQPTEDTPENAVVDAAAWILGWGVGYRLTDPYPLKAAKPFIEPKLIDPTR
jgi:hypothetical protein